MRRIIVVLIVLAVVLSGCDKIKMELERRHLGAAVEKENDNSQKTLPVKQEEVNVKQDNDKETSKRKQIVFRIDLPADEKIQIRLIKNSVPEDELKNDVAAPSKENAKEAVLFKENGSLDKPDSPIEQEKKPQPEQPEAKDVESKSEIKSETDSESRSEMKTDDEETFPPPPVQAPTVVVPAKEMIFQSALPDNQVKRASERAQPSEMAPAEKAVGLALGVDPPETISSIPNKPSKAVPSANALLSNPWTIPNADYPLRYYE